jgi:hypothetical protein
MASNGAMAGRFSLSLALLSPPSLYKSRGRAHGALPPPPELPHFLLVLSLAAAPSSDRPSEPRRRRAPVASNATKPRHRRCSVPVVPCRSPCP